MIKDGDEYIIKIRGIPWSSTVDEILNFFGDCNIKDLKNGIHLTKLENGRPSGEAYIELASNLDLERALKKNRQYMGHRYIEVFQTTRLEMNFVTRRCGLYADVIDEACVRLRGLPFDCSEADIHKFFDGLEVAQNGITFIVDDTDSKIGDAYVQFSNKDIVEKALERHMQKIRHRYVEIFRSSLTEMSSQATSKIKCNVSSIYGRSVPYDRNDRFARNLTIWKRPLLYHRGGIYFADQRVNFSTCELWNDNSDNEAEKRNSKIDYDTNNNSDGNFPACETLSKGNNELKYTNADLVKNSKINYDTNSNSDFSTCETVVKGNNEPKYTNVDLVTSSSVAGIHKTKSNNADSKVMNVKINDNKNDKNNPDSSLNMKTITDPIFDSNLTDENCSVSNDSYGIKKIALMHSGENGAPEKCNNNSVNVLVDRLNLHSSKYFNRSSPYMKNKSSTNETARWIHMRGLPYKATNDDIIKFFKPFKPIKIHIICDKSGRSSGEADVEFASHEEAAEAMIKDKQHIKTRYIELFLNYISQKSSTDKDDKFISKKKLKQKPPREYENHINDVSTNVNSVKEVRESFNNENSMIKRCSVKEQQPKVILLQRPAIIETTSISQQ